jgi:hypothetical protein
MISKLNETAGLWYYGGAVAYATTGYILGWIGLFNDSWAINAGATFLLGHSMIVAAYLTAMGISSLNRKFVSLRTFIGPPRGGFQVVLLRLERNTHVTRSRFPLTRGQVGRSRFQMGGPDGLAVCAEGPLPAFGQPCCADSCTIEAKFSVNRGVCSAENGDWGWLPLLTAQNLAERVEIARHLWEN